MAKKACTLTPSSSHLNICSLNSTIHPYSVCGLLTLSKSANTVQNYIKSPLTTRIPISGRSVSYLFCWELVWLWRRTFQTGSFWLKLPVFSWSGGFLLLPLVAAACLRSILEVQNCLVEEVWTVLSFELGLFLTEFPTWKRNIYLSVP